MDATTSKPSRPAAMPAMRRRPVPYLAAFLATLMALPVNAAVDFPNTPLQSGSTVPPNILFILDDSGSMQWHYMYNPTIASITNGGIDSGPTGDRNNDNDYRSDDSNVDAIYDLNYITNTQYYNPNVTYLPWRNADGSYMANRSYGSAYTSASYAGGNTTNLGNADRYFYVPIGMANLGDARSYYRYALKTNGSVERCERIRSGSWGWRNCVTVSSMPWRQKADGSYPTASDERANFANWYSYHRTRIKAAKAGAGYAFAEIGENVRVGYNSIWNRDRFDIPVNSDGGLFRDVGASSNKSDWYENLYDASGSNGTPLHTALQRAGQYFSSTGANGPWGPGGVADQITCRQNFAILTTDGFWNSGQTGSNQDDSNGTEHVPDPNLNPVPSYTRYIPARPYRDGNSGTLADMAMLYWKQDLRSDLVNNVPWSSEDPAFWQHMVTFGISIGLRGTLNPETALPGLTSGATSWPNPLNTEDERRIDDLWHAAVNSRGQFIAASDPNQFTQGLRQALATIQERQGAASNVSTNSTRVETDSRAFQASFLSGKWTGELMAYPVTETGIGDALWRASAGVPAHGSRRIFTHTGGVGGGRGRTFTWGNLTGAQRTALGGATNGPLVLDYLRGDTSREERNGGTYRDRVSTTPAGTVVSHVLGDMIHSSPEYVEVDPDNNPATNNSSHTVYVGANDGMLHAFDALTGVERFAYVPSGINFAQLATLTSKEYPHRYFVDGEIAVSTREQTPGRNILVGLLGRGGKTLYALDVSNPSTFGATDVLWEFTDPDLGNALGEPVITRLNNGRVGVVLGNGYNSVNGRSALLVVDIETGALIKKFDTGVGGDNGMAEPRGWDSNRSGTFDFLYAGDLLGNVWKVNVSSTAVADWNFSVRSGATPAPIFRAVDGSNNPQPITGGMALGLDPSTFRRWVYFGTGRYLTPGDPANRDRQSWYGFEDNAIDTTGEVVTRAQLKERAFTYTSVSGERVRVIEEPTLGDMLGKKGWVLDLEVPTDVKEGGERIISQSVFAGPALLVSSIIPSSSACTAGGRGYVNAINPFTGGNASFFVTADGSLRTVNGDAVSSIDPGTGMPSEPAVVRGGDGTVTLVVGGSDGRSPVQLRGQLPGSWGRISWREILRD